jgi:Zn-dependent peptidase ImmA (M78 family)/DNA-binding XRE family transcriptional regulator
MPFNPQRLSIARKRRLLNQKGLAEKVGVAAHTISRCEQGQTVPSEETVQAFAKVLSFPLAFFYGLDLDIPSAELVSFRSQKSMTAATRDAALSAGAIGFLVSDWIEDRFELPSSRVPDLHLYEAEAAAITLRQEWGLGEKPISNIVHLLESKGVRVLSLAENSKRVNAFSLWRAEKAYVFLNTMKSAENSRFDAAHELGHLVLHQDGKTTGRQAEDQANRFASAFLMPKADVLAVIPRVHYLEQIVQAKKRWRVSVAALNYRLHKIGVTTDWKYRDFCIQISQNGFNVNEPHEIEREKSIVWQKVMKTLWAEKTTQKNIADALHLPESEVNTLIFGILHSGGNRRPYAVQPLSLVKTEQTA